LSTAIYTQTSTNVTNNAFVIDLPDALPAYAAYAVFYPSTNNNSGALTTPTAVPFKNTRSFNPVHRDPLFRKARIYYSDVPVKDLEARVYDTAGQLLRTLNVANGGLRLTDLQTDPAFGSVAYYFEWDGRNDAGTLGRNGIYLIRWKLTRYDGSVESQTKPVAMIK
jgi:hypothetical protein